MACERGQSDFKVIGLNNWKNGGDTVLGLGSCGGVPGGRKEGILDVF